jgi:signal transduction histidine kinase
VPAALGDPHQIAVVIRSVTGNAIEAMEQGGTLSVGVAGVTIDSDFSRRHPPLKPGLHVCVTIADSGPGMPPDILDKAFDPFFSTKPAAHCTGTGLTIARSLLRKNSACIELESVEGKGTVARIFLPAVLTPQ